MINNEPWSAQAWKAIEPIYKAIIRHPFIRNMIEGSTDRSYFMTYLNQDAIYLSTYSKMLAHLASRLDDKDAMADVLRFASDGIAVERALHEKFLEAPYRGMPASPTCLMYTAVEEAQALRPAAVEAACLLPCFWVYYKVGQYILENVVDLENNWCADWIRTYADKTFERSTMRYIEICDSLAAEATDEVRREMTEIFKTCTRLEWMFWDSAYNMDTDWKV